MKCQHVAEGGGGHFKPWSLSVGLPAAPGGRREGSCVGNGGWRWQICHFTIWEDGTTGHSSAPLDPEMVAK